MRLPRKEKKKLKAAFGEKAYAAWLDPVEYGINGRRYRKYTFLSPGVNILEHDMTITFTGDDGVYEI